MIINKTKKKKKRKKIKKYKKKKKQLSKGKILANEMEPHLDHLERKGYIKGAWRNGKKVRLLKTLNQKIITKI